jgi:uncharacterized phage protein (predicted DNA packaging)
MYISLAELKEYLKIDSGSEDHILEECIEDAQAQIEGHTSRVFEASADSTRYFAVGKDTDEDDLYFDEDICAITTVKTNADNGSGGTTIIPSYYFTTPRNRTPYFKITLSSDCPYSWDYTNNPEGGITVTGKWAYSLTAPYDIKRACRRLAGYNYKNREAQVFDTTAIPEQGVIMIPKGIPADVIRILEPYRKLV